jgi:hypothetical protein
MALLTVLQAAMLSGARANADPPPSAGEGPRLIDGRFKPSCNAHLQRSRDILRAKVNQSSTAAVANVCATGGHSETRHRTLARLTADDGRGVLEVSKTMTC